MKAEQRAALLDLIKRRRVFKQALRLMTNEAIANRFGLSVSEVKSISDEMGRGRVRKSRGNG